MRTLEQKREYHRNYGRRYYHLNIEKIRNQRNIWVKNNLGKVRETDKKWKNNNPEKIRDRWLKKLYGISIDEYNEMFIKQAGLCGICGLAKYRKDRLMVDHNHDTKKVRGLLCDTCNKALGFLKDDILLLEKAIFYLKKYE